MKRCFSRRPLWILILEYRPRVVSGNATFKAGSLVRLQPGFQAATGTTFSVYRPQLIKHILRRNVFAQI